ncbi:ribonuclease H-like protein, partial [Coprinellus micaceus]
MASALEKLPPRPAPTCAYTWNEASPSARLVYLRDADEANQVLSRLQPGPLGFDLEWKPTYVKGGHENRVALVQLANGDTIHLIQISAMKEFPSKLREILEDGSYIKAGVGIQGDTKKLFTDWGVSVRSCADLSLLARTVDGARWRGKYNVSIGLARLVEIYPYRLLGKGKITRSNWEGWLKPAQQQYAANDAHAGFHLYQLLMAMA